MTRAPGIIATFFGLLLASCATQTVRPPAAPATPLPSSGSTPDRIAEARRLLAELKVDEGEEVLEQVIEAPGFERLPTATRYEALLLGANGWLRVNKNQHAYNYLSRAVTLPECTYEDALLDVRVALALDLKPDAVNELTEIAGRWPAQVPDLDMSVVNRVLSAANDLPPGSSLPLLRGLYAGRLKMRSVIEPSWIWRDLTLLLVESNDPSAAAVAAHIANPYVIIGMRSDQRYDALVTAHPELFDVDAADARAAKAAESAAARYPRSLILQLEAIQVTNRRQGYGAMIGRLDALLASVRASQHPEQMFDDYSTQYSWLLDLRAQTLQHLGRGDEAIRQMEEAAAQLESGRENISQTINLAMMDCRQGRGTEALQAIGRLKAEPSAYGRMLVEQARLRASILLGDAGQTERSLDYMRQHRGDAESPFLTALILANRLDEAAEVIKQHLRDPQRRADELMSMQHFKSGYSTPIQVQFGARDSLVRDRPDVQAEVEKVGRIATYDLLGPNG
jgi:hypothetical protein